MINIEPIEAFSDNYIWLVTTNEGSIVIDPGESQNLLKTLKENNLNLKAILITHHHFDHTGGINEILAEKSIDVYGPNNNIDSINIRVANESKINLLGIEFEIIEIPGHTLDHIAYYSENNGHPILFCGDTLFRLGCGRVFEGTLNEMFNSLKKINELDKNTIIYCGHEYTIGNLNFLEKTLKKESAYLTVRNKINDDLNNKGKSVPFLLEDEKQYNLFLNQNSKLGTIIKKELGFTDFELFAYLRKAKDSF